MAKSKKVKAEPAGVCVCEECSAKFTAYNCSAKFLHSVNCPECHKTVYPAHGAVNTFDLSKVKRSLSSNDEDKTVSAVKNE